MARPKSFDEDEVLDAAIDCFRRHGLKSASIRDLADEMGIAGPSLYNA
jgi:TetR/AcrR family transcriptional repressor of nem operon